MTPERWQQVRRLFDEAVALQADARPAYLDKACAADPELRREVESLLASDRKAGNLFLNAPAINLKDPLAELNPVPTRVGRRIGVYDILEEIGHGGMGEVYRAVRADGQFTKQVALKLVRGGFDSRSVVERFLNERQILASLDHPNIARLLDGGTTEDGIPYLVMELIDGTPLDQYCDRRRLSITARLRLFLGVCAAVQYAHQHLVIHRDLKPGNILVDEEGEPKLLDFGIAKILDPLAPGDNTLARPMTPEYASPEQIRGETITTATDVYSLGVVLYQLLAGHSPYGAETRTPHELERAITEVEPGRPSAVVLRTAEIRRGDRIDQLTPELVSRTREGSPARLRRRLAGDLDNIVLKAMRKEPERRYASVERFGEDLRRHLEGLPVTARKDSWSYRALKFVHRHKVAMASAAFVVLAVLGGVGATIREARIAAANARRAEKRFNDVRKLADSFLFEFHDAIEHLPGSTPARELVVKRALEYLDSLNREAGNDSSLRRELATAYEKVGTVQGSPNRDNLGNYRGALASFRKAHAIREQLAQTSSHDDEIHSELARDDGLIGEVLAATGDLKGALESYLKELGILESAPHPGPSTLKQLQSLCVVYGEALSSSGDLEKAVESYRRAVAIADDLLKETPKDPETRRDKAIASLHLGDGYEQMRQLPEALANHRAAQDLFASLVTPANAQSRRDVGVANERVADDLQKMGDKRGALAIRTSVLAEDLASAQADPANALRRRDVYIDYYKVANLQSALGNIGAALANQRRSVALCEAAADANPASAETRNDLAVLYSRFAEILKKTPDKAGALRYFHKAMAITQALSTANPADLGPRADLSEIGMNISDLELQRGDAAAALAGYRQAASLCESIVAANPTNAEWRSLLALIDQKLGSFYSIQARGHSAGAHRPAEWEEARRWYRKSLDLWTGLQQQNGLGADYASKPAEVSRQMAQCESALGGSRP